MGKIFRNDVGVEFHVDTKISLVGVTVKKLVVRKPSGSLVDWDDPTVSSEELVYTSLATDLDEVGTYSLAAYVEFGSTSKHYGETVRFKVYEPLA